MLRILKTFLKFFLFRINVAVFNKFFFLIIKIVHTGLYKNIEGNLRKFIIVLVKFENFKKILQGFSKNFKETILETF